MSYSDDSGLRVEVEKARSECTVAGAFRSTGFCGCFGAGSGLRACDDSARIGRIEVLSTVVGTKGARWFVSAWQWERQ